MMEMASVRIYTGDETFRLIKELMRISEKYFVQPGSYWSLYKGFKKEGKERVLRLVVEKNSDKS